MQIECHEDGVNILHILNIEHHHSGEVQCTAYNPINPFTTQRSCYADLAILPRPVQLIHLDNDFLFASTTISTTEVSSPTVATPITELKFQSIADVPAYVISTPNDCTALIGGIISLTIQFGGFPVPTVKWLRAVSIFYFVCYKFCFNAYIIESKLIILCSFMKENERKIQTLVILIACIFKQTSEPIQKSFNFQLGN